MKVVFELQESPARKFLRYALWTVLILGMVALVVKLGEALVGTIREGSLRETTSLLVQYAPEQALGLAEKLWRMAPTSKTKLALVKIAVETREWELADFLMENERGAEDFRLRAYNAMVLAHVAPAELPKALEGFRPAPQNDEERLLLARAALETGDAELTKLARKALQAIGSEGLRDRAALLMAQISQKAGDADRARELCRTLLSRDFAAHDALRLLELCEELRLAEADDYRSTLKVEARKSAPLTLALARHLAGMSPPEEVAGWVASLPAEVKGHPAVRMLLAELYFKAGAKEQAAAAVKGLGSTALEENLRAAMAGRSPTLANLDAKELATLVCFARECGLYPQEAQALLVLNERDPTLWSLREAIRAAEKNRQGAAQAAGWMALNKALGGNLLAQAQGAYWRLLDASKEDKAAVQEAYEALKKAAARHPKRTDVQAGLALAHERLGNLTDALLALPERPQTPRAQLIAAWVFAKSQQFEKADALIKEISAEELSGGEQNTYEEILKQLRSNAPLQRFFELIRQK